MVRYFEKKNPCLETEELCTINISPLVTTPFSLQWSPDNQISLITEKGVHIFELKPSPMSSNPTIKFARSFIYPSDILPTFTFVEKMQSLIWNLDHQDLYLMLMEEALTPRMKDVNDTILSIEKVAWSPKNLIFSNHSILAILTKAGAVELLHKVFDEWYSIYDVSSFRMKNLENSITSTLKQCKRDSNYAEIIQSLRQVQACSMTWSKLFEVKKTVFTYFCVAYRSGDISVLKIPKISNLTNEIQLLLVGSINLKIPEKITLLHWISLTKDNHLLIVGYYTGQLCSVELICRDDNNDVQVTSTITYFDSDCIAIDNIQILSQDESEIRFLVVKGIFLLLICINSKGKLKSIQHLQIEGFSITGIIPIHDQQVLITTQDCRTIIVDTQSNSLNSINIKNHLPQLHVQYLGLAHSPNKAMVVIVTSPTVTYDHLILREPSVMLVFALEELSNPLSIIKNSNTSLLSVWDCLEVLRLKAVKADDPKTIFGSIPEELSLSLYDLQLSMWMAIMINMCTTKKSISRIDQISEISIKRLISLIFVHSACAYLESLIRKNELSTDETLAITLLRNYIEIYVNDENNENVVQQHAREILKAVAMYPNETEKCHICSEPIEELWKSSVCPNGHKLSRCSVTLLQVQWEYHVCPLCNRIFHPCLEAVYKELRCQYCDVSLLHNFHTFNLEPYGRNLSQLQPNADEPSKEVDELDEQMCIHKKVTE
ncbi:uncharacterized protein LOC109862629 [Pseudomyrmex gracilis]|uniref:uncharacterized protein LOC109862629 n=1 Tax=Pseudomyrmex gracilis TaxID=219809 RepID=UPI0009954620|nr:uncharacterized protein LOC109862629 [Pseudomyrmex gracilis]